VAADAVDLPAPLVALGWHAGLDEAFRPFRAEGLVPARVVVVYGATFRVQGVAGDELADLSGRLRHEARGRRDLPAVGDWVVVKSTTIRGGRATIQAVLPRKSLFSRKVAGLQTSEQILAANVDTAFLVTALDGDYNPRRLERYLTMTLESGASPVIVLNKADLVESVDELRAEVESLAFSAPVLVMAARQGLGLERLDPYLRPGSTIAVLGSSGVGKSTIINRLLGEERLATGEVRQDDHRGRHTTTHRELVTLPGGALLIDTPGMRELQLWTADAGIAEAFDDIGTLAAGCFFADCTHEHEPRCAVKAAVERGELVSGRLENFHKLHRELASLTVRQDALAQQEGKKRAKSQQRALRKHLRTKGRS
jgi:ribosome biogenesis GTPase / thiamine phosphate phosphatase